MPLSAGNTLADEPLVFGSEMSPGLDYARNAVMDEAGVDGIDVVIAEADFNNDGRVDVLAFALSSYFCGSGGCGPRLYLNAKKGWRNADIYAIGEPENWSVLDASHNGFRKLAMITSDEEQIFAWDGSAYVLED